MEKIHENNSLLCKTVFSSATKTYFFIKNTKNNRPSASEWWEYTKYCFKENANIFFQKLHHSRKYYKNFKIKKKDLKFVQKVNFKPKIKPVIENLQNELDQ